MSQLPSTGKIYRSIDLFCGGGGSGSGIIDAFKAQGKTLHGAFINHWDKAINIHSYNHPNHVHKISGVDAVNPRTDIRDDQDETKVIYANEEIHFLWGSPECTHHSLARGGKPMNEQSRSTAQCLIRWIRYRRPECGIVENVKEFLNWGDLMQKRCKTTGKLVWVMKVKSGGKGRPKNVETTDIPFRQAKGEHKHAWRKRLSEAGFEMSLVADPKKAGRKFQTWKRKIMKMGFLLDWKVLRSADYGDPTSRQRLFVQFVRIDTGKKIVWPNPTHAKRKSDGSVSSGLRPWRTAREIIDWSNLGQSIFTRKRPLSQKTLKRIAIGLEKYGLRDFIVPQQAQGRQVKSVDEPVSPVTTRSGEGLARPAVKPFVLPQNSDGDRVQSIDVPAPAVTTTSRGIGVVQGNLEPCVVHQMGQSTAQSVDEPLSAVVGGPKHFVLNPAMIKLKGTATSGNVDLPLDTITAGGLHHAIMQAFLVATDQQGSNGSCTYPLSDPIKTTVTKANQAIVTTAMTQIHADHCQKPKGDAAGAQDTSAKDPERSASSTESAVPKKTRKSSRSGAGGAVIQTAHGVDHNDEARRVKSPDDPLGTIHASGGSYAVMQPKIEPFIAPQFGERAGQEPRTHSVDEPTPAVTSHGAGAVVQGELKPFMVGTAYSGADETRVRGILEPLAIVCGNRGDQAVVRPWLYTYYSSGGVGSDIDAPTPTARTHDGIGFVYPVIEIQGNFFILDIYFRMLGVRELARAQGFSDDYQFPGTKTDAVKAIGNAVSCGIARALTLAVTTQNPDISGYLPPLQEAA